jgi:hypothetical protein
MPRSRFVGLLSTFIAVGLLSSLSSCIVTKDSPAPGCVESLGFSMMGGCFGQTAILDLTAEPEIACLEFTVNNCNGGVLEVNNSCEETLVFDGVEIPSSGSANLDVVEEVGGRYSLRDVGGNFSDYIPDEDKRIAVTGVLGSQEVEVTFTKTAQLCE